MIRVLLLAPIFGATATTLDDTVVDSVNTCDDAALSLVQLRANPHQRTQLEWGHEVKARPLVDDNYCDGWDMVDGSWVLNETKYCIMEVRDDWQAFPRSSPEAVTGVQFFANKVGNGELQFGIYRHGHWPPKTAQRSQPIHVTQLGFQEHTFDTPLLLLNGDYAGFLHNGHGNIAYSDLEDDPQAKYVSWNADGGPSCLPGEPCAGTMCDQLTLRGVVRKRKTVLPAAAKRTYSYKLITRPATKDDVPQTGCFGSTNSGPPPQSLLDSLPDATTTTTPAATTPAATTPAATTATPVDDGASAVGDPHMHTATGHNFDMQ